MQHPFPALAPEYAASLARMVVTDAARVEQAAREIIPGKARYKAVEAATKIPAAWLGAVDYREDDCNPRDGLGQGDPWNKVSVHVPAGCGPFPSWQAAAIFYLRHDRVDVLSVPAWTWPYACWKGEAWNGFGSRSHGVHSGYDWGCTSVYTGGGYPRDGDWSATWVDRRPGIIPIMRYLVAADADFAFAEAPIAGATEAAGQVSSPIPSPPPEGVDNALWIQRSLNALGVDDPLREDGNYGRRTRTAVARFQASSGLAADGLAGPLTVAAIEKVLLQIGHAPGGK